MSEVDIPMSNTELRLKFSNQDAVLSSISGKLDEVIKHASHTNGSIGEAIIEINKLKQWRNGLAYAFAVFSSFVIPVLGVTLFRVWDSPQITSDQVQVSVNQGIAQAIAARDAARAAAQTNK